MPPSATPLEMALFWPCLFGLFAAVALFYAAAERLIGRYQDGRNGAARLLAWERVVLCVIVLIGLAAGTALSALLLIIPAPDDMDIGAVERWARETGKWFNLPAILVMLYSLIAIPLALFGSQWHLDLIMRRDATTWTADRHPHRRRDDPPTPPEGGVQ